MDPSRYDALTKAIAQGHSRRRLLAGLLSFGVGATIEGAATLAKPTPCTPGGPCQRTRDCCPSEQCINGVCGGGGGGPSCVATGCPPSAVPCQANVCNQATGACALVPDSAQNGQACNDGNACTGPDTCSNGVCSGPQISCDDGDPCTTNSCNSATGCVFTQITCTTPSDACHTSPGSCSGGVCSYPDLRCPACAPCSGGACVPDDSLCVDPNPCTQDLCDPDNGCLHPPVADGTPCGFGTCQGGICTPTCAGEYESCDGVACCEGFCVTDVIFFPHLCCGQSGAYCSYSGLDIDGVCCSGDCQDSYCV